MGNSTWKRPRPTGKTDSVWQPASTCNDRLRRADTVHHFDLADDSHAGLPVEDRQLPPLTARNCLRDFGLCRGSAAVLFSLFALIAFVTTNSNTDLPLCRQPTLPPAQECPRQPARPPPERSATLCPFLALFVICNVTAACPSPPTRRSPPQSTP